MKKLWIGMCFLFFLIACSSGPTLTEESWKKSSTFDVSVTLDDGTKETYRMVGVKDRLGILVDSGESTETNYFIQGAGNKYMWHFWGTEEEFDGEFKVIATNEQGETHPVLIQDAGTPQEKKVESYPPIDINSHNGADAHTPSSLEFPSSGLWKLEVQFGNARFGELVVEVSS